MTKGNLKQKYYRHEVTMCMLFILNNFIKTVNHKTH